MATYYIITTKQKWSQKNQEHYFELELVNRDDGALYRTYISPTNSNYKFWEAAIDEIDSDPECAVGIEGDFKLVKGQFRLVNADTKFSIIGIYDLRSLLNGIVKLYYS